MPYKDPQKNYELRKRYANKMYHQRRDEFLAGKACVLCGSTKDLEVDHIDPQTKEVKICHVWLRSQKVREAELAKCQVLCSSCHKLKTWEKDRERATHGTYTMYSNNGCRCKLCREAYVAKRIAGKTEIQHGTYSAYTNRRCRCDACRAAATAYHRQLRNNAKVCLDSVG